MHSYYTHESNRYLFRGKARGVAWCHQGRRIVRYYRFIMDRNPARRWVRPSGSAP